MDLRIQKTKNNIFNAYIELREKKPIEKITVKELTDKAQISKQTFYLHYKDIYDLTEQIEQELIADIMKDVEYPENVLDSLKDIAFDIFNRALALGQPFKTLFSGSRTSVLTTGIETGVKNAVYKQHPELRADLKTNIYITYLVHGCYNAYQQYKTIDQERVVKIITDITDIINMSYKK
ncbi:MAG: TetR/AcrR family transcriptional regulator [Lachnospiraceae bacterium]|nr:TetR/AcrR family transcriptional regulator [Lachnospiraceae bacterium]